MRCQPHCKVCSILKAQLFLATLLAHFWRNLCNVFPELLRFLIIREIKFDVTWSYVKRQTAKMTSEFVFFSSNPSLNHIKLEKCLLLFATNTNICTLLFKEIKTEGKSFIFAVCRLTYDHVTSNLISLMSSLTSGPFHFEALFR